MTTRKYKLAIIEDSDEDLKLLTDNLDRYKTDIKRNTKLILLSSLTRTSIPF